MSLYPSLEDMKVDQILKKDQQNQPPSTNFPFNSLQNERQQPTAPSNFGSNPLYPTMESYMGLDLTASEMAIIERQQQQLANLQLAQIQPNEIAVFSNNKHIIAPISGNSAGLKRSQITNGVREVILCKDSKNLIGMRCKSINNGIFVVLVTENSPAALAGLRFGDQILQVNDQYVAGMSHQKLHDIIKKLSGDRITLAVRDRPLERTVTLHKG